MDAVAPGSFGSTTFLISLVKSDWKLQQKTEISRSTPRRFRLRFASGCQGAFGN